MTKNVTKTFLFIQAMLLLVSFIALSSCESLKKEARAIATLHAFHKQPHKPHQQLWCRMRDNFEITAEQTRLTQHPHVQKYVKKFSKEENDLTKISAQATPYLYYIVEQLEARNMPGELALLPMIESAFKPQATSHKGAAGLWQFTPNTGRLYGLKQNNWYDGRRDIQASTKAALDHLEFLHQAFDHNWMLALAAYNAGGGTVQRAIQNNKRKGLPTNFWDLKLPKETREYVPKFLALAQVIGNPNKHAISLPHIDNKPYFVPVNPGTPLHLHQVAQLAGVDIQEIKKLNPAYRHAYIHYHTKTPQEILLPVASQAQFEYNLARKR
jgi:membrane-bound lytic murein transglycosylase D